MTVQDKDPATSKPIDKEFIRRLEQACENHPLCPSSHGRQKWIREKLLEQFGTKVSAEAMSKWFKGETKPRRDKLAEIAEILRVDEAWLYLGTTLELSPSERKTRSKIADATVELVGGMIQMHGGHVAYNEDPSSKVDFNAIINRAHLVVKTVIAVSQDGNKLHFVLPEEAERMTVIAVIPTENLGNFTLLKIPHSLIAEHGDKKGDTIDIWIERKYPGFEIHGNQVPTINSLSDLA